jgi:hypothetical protein
VTMAESNREVKRRVNSHYSIHELPRRGLLGNLYSAGRILIP